MCLKQNGPPERDGRFMFRERDLRLRLMPRYFGGAGVNTSRFWLGSGLGLGLGAFFASLRPLSLLPMQASVPQVGGGGEVGNASDRANRLAASPAEGQLRHSCPIAPMLALTVSDEEVVMSGHSLKVLGGFKSANISPQAERRRRKPTS